MAAAMLISCGTEETPVGPTALDGPASQASPIGALPIGQANVSAHPAAGLLPVTDAATTDALTVNQAIQLPSIDVGGTIQLTSDCVTPATWRSSDPLVATVVDGLVTGVGAGVAQISETCAGVTSSLLIAVVQTTFDFEPVPPTEITEDDTGHFRVNVRRSGRRTRIVEGVTSSDENVVRLRLEGDRYRYTGDRPGVVEIRVTYAGKRRLTHRMEVEAKPAPPPPPPPPPQADPWRRSGTGATILDLPTRIRRIRIEGEYNGGGENFVVWCGSPGDHGGLLVNVILGTRRSSTRYSGIHSAIRSYGGRGQPCRELEIKYSQGVRWTITETSPRSGLSPNISTGSAIGDAEAVRRTRIRNIRARADR